MNIEETNHVFKLIKLAEMRGLESEAMVTFIKAIHYQGTKILNNELDVEAACREAINEWDLEAIHTNTLAPRPKADAPNITPSKELQWDMEQSKWKPDDSEDTETKSESEFIQKIGRITRDKSKQSTVSEPKVDLGEAERSVLQERYRFIEGILYSLRLEGHDLSNAVYSAVVKQRALIEKKLLKEKT